MTDFNSSSQHDGSDDLISDLGDDIDSFNGKSSQGGCGKLSAALLIALAGGAGLYWWLGAGADEPQAPAPSQEELIAQAKAEAKAEMQAEAEAQAKAEAEAQAKAEAEAQAKAEAEAQAKAEAEAQAKAEAEAQAKAEAEAQAKAATPSSPEELIADYMIEHGSDMEFFVNPDKQIVLRQYKRSTSEPVQAEVLIPDFVVEIADEAFGDEECCKNIVRIKLPSSVTTIGKKPFGGCSSLVSVQFGNERFVNEGGMLIDSQTGVLFDVLPKILNPELNIPNSVKIIGHSAFYNCKTIKSVVIPDSVTILQECAFMECSNLDSLIIPKSVQEIGMMAIDCGSSTLRINNAGGSTATAPSSQNALPNTLDAAEMKLSMAEHERSSGKLFNFSFRAGQGVSITKCNKKQSHIVMPDFVTHLDSKLFYYWGNLKSVELPRCLTSIGDRVFSYCSSLESITLPEAVKSIGEYAFYECSSLQSVRLPAALVTLGNDAFYNCDRLHTVKFSDNVKTIGDKAFSDCAALRHVTLSANLESLGEDAFSYCDSLEEISIPASVKKVGKNAFRNCKKLKTIWVDIESPALKSLEKTYGSKVQVFSENG